MNITCIIWASNEVSWASHGHSVGHPVKQLTGNPRVSHGNRVGYLEHPTRYPMGHHGHPTGYSMRHHGHPAGVSMGHPMDWLGIPKDTKGIPWGGIPWSPHGISRGSCHGDAVGYRGHSARRQIGHRGHHAGYLMGHSISYLQLGIPWYIACIPRICCRTLWASHGPAMGHPVGNPMNIPWAFHGHTTGYREHPVSIPWGISSDVAESHRQSHGLVPPDSLG